ncbi:MAG: hypothetical protein MZW92_36855 [Comamonadaceae bacterium]|nr:hypothetical protein [Comamonadaceae bacterium]
MYRNPVPAPPRRLRASGIGAWRVRRGAPTVRAERPARDRVHPSDGPACTSTPGRRAFRALAEERPDED